MPILVCNLLVSRYLHGLRIGARLTSHANELVRLTVLGPSARRVDSDLYLMTSRELTFGHVVISASPCCIFPYNLMQDIFIQSKVIDIFPKFKMAAAAILDFQLCKFGHTCVLVVWYLCSVPNLVQISVIVTEIDALLLQTFI